jgi:putative SOS response-associated peptidase YedK
MCNLYNITTTHAALHQLVLSFRDASGSNYPPSLDIYPNHWAPVVRVAGDGERELAMLQWGMPTPPDRVKGNADRGTTNIRNPTFNHWKQFLGIENRCIVPATSFAEPSPKPNDKDPETGIGARPGCCSGRPPTSTWSSCRSRKPRSLFRRRQRKARCW